MDSLEAEFGCFEDEESEDVCVLCGEELDVDSSHDIGDGRLCDSCWKASLE